MLNKNDLLDAMIRECDICIHLYKKIPEGGLEYRPSPVQRNTLELLRYLSFMAVGATKGMIDGDWTLYTQMGEAAEKLEPEDFIEAMEGQKRELRKLFDAVSEEDMENRKSVLPWGETTKMARGILELPYRCLVGYRMQLFLYAKAAGNHDLATPNCWIGVDIEPQE